MASMKKFRFNSRQWPGVVQWFVGAGKLLLMFTVALLILACVMPALAVVALGFLALIVLLIAGALLYGMFKVRQIRRQMREFSRTFTERYAAPSADPPPRPRQRVQCKVRETSPPDSGSGDETTDDK